MKKICLLLFVFSATMALGSDSLRIGIISTNLQKKDTLEFRCIVPDFKQLKLASATLNVWIEDIEKHTRWKFRYPMINGEVSAALAVSDKIPDGRYAVNFLVQRGFFKVMGEVLDHDKKDTSITYMMILKNKAGNYIDNARVEVDGSFRLKSTLFADSAFFIFSPAVKTKNNYLFIKMETPLDSAFIPVLAETHFITIGDPKTMLSAQVDTGRYVFQFESMSDPDMLPGVTVTTKFKKKVDQYNEEFSRGQFQNPEAIIFDGIENDAIGRSSSIMVFLQGKVPGLVIEKNDVGLDIAKWRNEPVEIYLDEFKVEVDDHTFISPSEVAMIKVYRPPAGLSSILNGSRGAIAIYTKKGVYATNTKQRHNFIVKGYTKFESSWQ